MIKAFVVAQKEFRDAWREKLLVVLIACLGLLVVVSIIVATIQIGVDVSTYQQALAKLHSSGQTSVLTPPQYSPLQMLRSSIEYLEIIGAIFAIVLGYTSIARERTSGALKLIFSRAVTKTEYVTGKILGNLAIIATIVVSFCLFAYLSIFVLGQVLLSPVEVLKLAIAGGLSIMYLMIFYSLAALLATRVKSLLNGLVVALVFWVSFVLILPQIGDTMDVDNQVPGGFFASLNLPKTAEKSVLTHFSAYETFRNTTEVMSPTKHFERASFAVLGIKNIYNGQPLSSIWNDKWGNVVVLGAVAIGMTGLLYIGFIKNKEI
jgi:ABC-type transport system involved in multi-copper enzyme maturation permease subunit